MEPLVERSATSLRRDKRADRRKAKRGGCVRVPSARSPGEALTQPRFPASLINHNRENPNL
jgi:hypothetical protein